jgi:osmotically inducible protein OsmC
LVKLDTGFAVTKIEINTEGSVEGVDTTTFLKYAEETKSTCPVSRALSVEMVLSAKLK